ncbi:MAG: globin [Glaciihabitans sp.]|nr:globin [Glaciihabitans sp.]
MLDTTPAGADVVSRAITIFAERLRADGKLAWSFEGSDTARMHSHARAFVIAALGGPDLYVGRDLRTTHESLRLRDEHFDAAVVHLAASFHEAGMDESLITALAARLEPLRRQIVSPAA